MIVPFSTRQNFGSPSQSWNIEIARHRRPARRRGRVRAGRRPWPPLPRRRAPLRPPPARRRPASGSCRRTCLEAGAVFERRSGSEYRRHRRRLRPPAGGCLARRWCAAAGAAGPAGGGCRAGSPDPDRRRRSRPATQRRRGHATFQLARRRFNSFTAILSPPIITGAGPHPRALGPAPRNSARGIRFALAPRLSLSPARRHHYWRGAPPPRLGCLAPHAGRGIVHFLRAGPLALLRRLGLRHFFTGAGARLRALRPRAYSSPPCRSALLRAL